MYVKFSKNGLKQFIYIRIFIDNINKNTLFNYKIEYIGI